MLVLIPLAIVILLAFFAICLVGGPVIALVASPFAVICTSISIEYCQTCCPIWCIAYLMVLPLVMIGAVVASFFVIAYNVGMLISLVFWTYLQTAIFLLCNTPDMELEDDLEI